MKNLIYREIDERDFDHNETGKRRMFAFAIDDFIARFELDHSYCDKHRCIFGAVLEEGEILGPENTEAFEIIMNLILENSKIDVIVFDINACSDVECQYLHDLFAMNISSDDCSVEFIELKDVYEDRVVFVRKV